MNKLLNNKSFHYTGATIVAIVGALLAVLVAFGLDLTTGQQQAILTLVGLVAGGIVVGGGIKSAGLFMSGEHPTQIAARAAYRGLMDERGSGPTGPPGATGPAIAQERPPRPKSRGSRR